MKYCAKQIRDDVYKITCDNKEADVNNSKCTLHEVLQMWSKTDKNLDELRFEYIKHQINQDSHNLPISYILTQIFMTLIFGLFWAIFTKFCFINLIFKNLSTTFQILICISVGLIASILLFVLAMLPRIKAIKYGKNDWLKIEKLYDDAREFLRNKNKYSSTSARRMSQSNVESYRSFVRGALSNGEVVDIIIEDNERALIENLKIVPVKIFKNKIFINKQVISFDKIEWTD